MTQGWLAALLRVFERRKDAGLVGAKLVYPDGRLQEAGGIIWRDASGVNYGKGDHPDKLEYVKWPLKKFAHHGLFNNQHRGTTGHSPSDDRCYLFRD